MDSYQKNTWEHKLELIDRPLKTNKNRGQKAGGGNGEGGGYLYVIKIYCMKF